MTVGAVPAARRAIRAPIRGLELPRMRLPHAFEARVPQRKIEGYLLAVDHPEGGAKARFFLRCGFTPQRPELLEAALRRVASSGRVVETVSVFHGTKYVVDGEIATPEGSVIGLRTVWIILASEEAPRFVTAYPLSRPES